MNKKITLLLAGLLFSESVFAYVGPGLGLGAIGAIIGVVLAILLGIFGLFWYPLKRLFGKKKNQDNSKDKKPESDSNNKEGKPES